MTSASAWTLAGALWLGCLVAGPWWCAPAGVGLAAAALAVRSDGHRLAALAVAVALVGAGAAGGRSALADGAALAAVAAAGGAVEVAAVLVTEPRTSEHGAWAVVRVQHIDGAPVRERAALRLDTPLPELGEQVAGRVTARPLGREGFDGHLRRLHAVAALDPAGELTVLARAGPLWRGTSALRARAREVAAARLDPDQAAILTGLLTGDVRGQSAQRREQLAQAGLTHLVVVSGRHVALLLTGVLGLVVLLGAGARSRRLLALGALAGYVVLVRWQPSVLRAGVMATLVLAAGLLGRRADARHSLAMAVLVLLLVDPLLAGHLGFGLSVSATAGVLVLTPWLVPRLPGPQPVRTLVAASLGAQAGAAPLLLTLDRGVSLAALPANLLAVPLAAAGQALGVVAVAVGGVSLPLGGAVALLARPFVGGILLIAEQAAVAPPLDPALLASPLLLALGAAVLLRRRAPRLALGALAGVVVLGLLPAVGPGPSVATLTVTALDVGQGDAILVEVPSAVGPPARLLVDGGPEDRVALRRLRERGVRALDAVAISHPHHDHTGGLPAVLGTVPVAALLLGPHPLDPARAAPSAAEAERLAAVRGIPVQRLSAGQRFRLGAAVVEVLSPPADETLPDDANERSLVLRVATDDGSVLLTGDAEQIAQAHLLTRPERLAATVLKVPHHGGATNAEGFLAAVGASDALIGVGGDNTYGHPQRSVLDELAGVRVHRTDEDGTVTLAITAQGVVRRRRRRRPALHCPPWHAPRCTCSPAPRSCCCAGPPSASSPSSRRRATSSSTTCGRRSCAVASRAGPRSCPICAPARCSAPAG